MERAWPCSRSVAKRGSPESKGGKREARRRGAFLWATGEWPFVYEMTVHSQTAAPSVLIRCRQFLESPYSSPVLSSELVGACIACEGIDAGRAAVEGHLGRLLILVRERLVLDAEVERAALDDIGAIGHQRSVGIKIG